MKIVATSDTHFPYDEKDGLIPDGDLLIHAGDLMYTGYPDEWLPNLTWLGNMRHKRKIFVPGNHDFHVQNYMGPAYQDCRKRKIQLIANKAYDLTVELPNKMLLLGLPWVTQLPGWAFNETEESLNDFVRSLPKADIVVSHSPPKGIADINDWGCRAWRLYQVMHKPEIWICGHIHEAYGEHAHNGTSFFNVAMCDRDYLQVNPAMVIGV